MLLGIISDTHDRVPRTTQAIRLLHEAGVDAVLHCGDICGETILQLFAGTPLYCVQGNNDFDDELRQAAQAMEFLTYLGEGDIIELAGKRLAMTHGHKYRVLDQLMKQQPDYLFTGHTHVCHNEMRHGVQCINPGAIHRASEYSVALLNLATNDLQFLPVP